MSENILTVKDLKTYFYTASGVAKAVDGVSFNIAKGETMGIVGESGSGKSVTSSSIIRLLPPRTGKIVGGSIEFEGKDVLALSKKELNDFRGKDIAVIFQDPMTSLDPVFKIGKQMTEMIIADEPTTALDVTVQAQVLELLKELQRDMDTAILLITHNLGVVWEMCDKVMVMYAGNTVEFTDTKTLYSNPRHPYTWGLLDSMPKLSDESKGELKTIPGTPPDLRLTGECCNFYNRCPYVTEACTQSVPPLVEVEPGHFVACHRQNLTNKLEKGEGLKDE